MFVLTAGSAGSVGPSDSAGPALQLRLYRQNDRWHSEVGCRDGNLFRPVLRSVEGGAAELWPPSPPLQQALWAATGDILLATGMAGNSHWSMSVESSAAGQGLTWDLACRIKHPARGLGSTYVWANGASATLTPRPLPDGGWLLPAAAGGLAIRPQADIGSPTMEWMDEADSRCLRIGPGEAAETYPQTLRWAYCMEWRPESRAGESFAGRAP